jgi:hypothetical protein
MRVRPRLFAREEGSASGWHTQPGLPVGDLQLWLGGDARKAAYLVEGTTMERWPRLTEPVGCVERAVPQLLRLRFAAVVHSATARNHKTA